RGGRDCWWASPRAPTCGQRAASPKRSPRSRWWSPCCAILGSAISACRSRKGQAMSIDVYIPTPFRRATNNKDRVSVEARDVRGLLDELEGRFSGFKGLVRNEAGGGHHQWNL